MPLAKLKTILAEFDQSSANELEYEDADLKIILRKNSATHPEAESETDDDNYILSPLVGIYHEATPAIKVSEKVLAGQTLCIIESMKVMNKICAPSDLIVNKLNFRNGEKVEHNSQLIEVTYL